MEQEIWNELRCAIRSADRRVPRTGRRKRFSDQLIVKMHFWAVWHDRPMCWACDHRNYTGRLRPKQVPSISQFSRRLRSERVRAISVKVNDYLTRDSRREGLSFFDGKPVTLNRNTRDKDAKKGYAYGKFERGYKIHAWVTSDSAIPSFSVRSLNEGEPAIARKHLVDHIREGSLVLADANYDSAPLYTAVHQRGGQLLTPLKGMSQRKDQLRRMGPGRRMAIRWWQNIPGLRKGLSLVRIAVERAFSALTCFGGGLTTLPPWVRGLERVTSWIAAKIAIFNARIRCQKRLDEVA